MDLIHLTFRGNVVLWRVQRNHQARREYLQNQVDLGFMEAAAAEADLARDAEWSYLSLRLPDRTVNRATWIAMVRGASWPVRVMSLEEAHESRAAGPGFREARGYRRAHDHAPKPDRDDAWRQLHRADKSKAGRSGWRHRGPGRGFKRIAAQEHRAWERRCIERGDWEAMGADSYREFADAYRWR